MTVPEIADAMAAPLETVRSRLRLGKAALRQALGGRDG
jgi:DNA-directed RNA polymerase specialized sigma24 family protein